MTDISVTKQGEYHVELRNKRNTLRIDVKWDGCTNIFTSSNDETVDDNRNPDNHDYIHICELKEFIEQLQQAYNAAKERKFEV